MFLSVFFLRNSLQFKKVSLPLQPQKRKTLSDANAKLRLAIKGPAPSSIG